MSASAAAPQVAEQFDDPKQQREASSLGMWVFLATEVMLFGGLILVYTVYRISYPVAWQAAGRQTNFVIGTANTVVLLCSSLSMALAVHAVREGDRGRLVRLLLLTVVLGSLFMGLKGYEYYDDWRKHLVPNLNFPANTTQSSHEAMFFLIYFIATGLHAIHLTIGICVVTIMMGLALIGRFNPINYTPIELTGLYWHFIDIVWVFLYPLLYLVGRSS